MKSEDRRSKIKAYKEKKTPMGVVLVRNKTSGRCLVDAANNAQARLNRHRALLRMGLHDNPDLLADWRAQGEEAFSFEVLDELKPKDAPHYDPRDDLEELKQMWLEKLGLAPETAY